MSTRKLVATLFLLFMGSVVTVSCCKSKFSILLTKTLELKVGETHLLKATVMEDNAVLDVSVSWSSSNPGIATVDENGTVHAVSPGKCTVKATYEKASASCEITVSERKIHFVWDKINLYKGAEHNLSVSIQGFDESYSVIYGSLVWESSDASVVRVNESGRIHAVSAGSATISATYDGVMDNCLIVVSDGYDIVVPEGITLKVGETKTVSSDEFLSHGGYYNFQCEISDNGYYASLPLVPVLSGVNSGSNNGSGGEETPEYKYSGLKLIGNHEGQTSLRIYHTESGFDILVPVTVLQE